MIYDGGFAFPVAWPDRSAPTTGMTLRDYFAAQVASGMAAFSGTGGIGFGPGEIAGRAYLVADAMIAARTQNAEELK